MRSSLYTNTSKVSGVVGLLVLTLGVAYVQANATEIVNGGISKAKEVKECLNSKIFHKGKKQYGVWQRRYDGTIVDTGETLWR